MRGGEEKRKEVKREEGRGRIGEGSGLGVGEGGVEGEQDVLDE